MDNPSHGGHRKRLRERFLAGGLEGFLDYEIVELLLTLGTPRRDCKQMAKDAISEFGNLRGVFMATYDDLQRIPGIGPSNAFGLKLFQSVSVRIAKELMPEQLKLGTTGEVVTYIKSRIGKAEQEHFLVLYLDAKHRLIEDRVITVGLINKGLIQPREVFAPIIALKSEAVVLAHNHPFGTANPSREDREITKQLVEAGEIMGVKVLDHIIVTADSHFSFADELLLL